MKRPSIIEAHGEHFAWVVTLDETESGTRVEACRWPVCAWELSEHTDGNEVTPVLPYLMHIDSIMGLEAEGGTIRWNGQLFANYLEFASAAVAEEWGCNAG